MLHSFAMINETNLKHLSKTIYALYLIYSISVLMKTSYKDMETNFTQITSSIERLSKSLDDNFKKMSFEIGEKIQLGYKQILIFRGYLIHWSLLLLEGNIELFLDTLYEDQYFQVIKTSFPYFFKFLIVFSIISKSKKYFTKLYDIFTTEEDQLEKNNFINLFFAIFVDYDNKSSFDLLSKCLDDMKDDYFLSKYADLFKEKTKEIAVENYLSMNGKINYEEFKLFFKDQKECKEYLIDTIKANYPTAEIKEEEDGIEFEENESSSNTYYKNEIEHLCDTTEQMIHFIEESEKEK
ncbi:MAG: eukaryotic translation initiation factor 3 subunit E [archaeon]|nr:eukaryotic translation initiation factor 3 subunit E [archaeon]